MGETRLSLLLVCIICCAPNVSIAQEYGSSCIGFFYTSTNTFFYENPNVDIYKQLINDDNDDLNSEIVVNKYISSIFFYTSDPGELCSRSSNSELISRKQNFEELVLAMNSNAFNAREILSQVFPFDTKNGQYGRTYLKNYAHFEQTALWEQEKAYGQNTRGTGTVGRYDSRQKEINLFVMPFKDFQSQRVLMSGGNPGEKNEYLNYSKHFVIVELTIPSEDVNEINKQL